MRPFQLLNIGRTVSIPSSAIALNKLKKKYLLTNLQFVEDCDETIKQPTKQTFIVFGQYSPTNLQSGRNERTVFIQKAIPSSSGWNVLNMDKSACCHYTVLLVCISSYYIFCSHLACLTIKSFTSVCWTKNTMFLKLFYQKTFFLKLLS